jgi:hypothetical protein
MSEALAINTKWAVRDFGTHLELRGDVGQFVSFENIGDLLECMDWLEKHFGHVREQRPTKRAADDGRHCECGEVLDIDGMCPDIANVLTHRR